MSARRTDESPGGKVAPQSARGAGRKDGWSMGKVAVCMADGCEEIEGLTVVDLLRRVKIDAEMVSVSADRRVTGSHGIAFEADTTADAADWDSYAAIILPGGMPGTLNLKKNERVRAAVKAFDREKKLVAAICAAPTVLADCGVLEGRAATCYPGLEGQLAGAEFRTDSVVLDGHVLTSRGVGTAIPFALAVAAYLKDRKTADELAKSIVYA